MSTSTVARDVLPKFIKPVHYNLEIFDINVKENTFEGKVKILLEIVEETDVIVLHADKLKFHSAKIIYSITKTQSQLQVESITYDEKKQTATLKLSEPLKTIANDTQLVITYSALIRNNMSGFYRSDYKDIHGDDQVLLSTQFEATDARTALPCFDEPNLKASFQLTLTAAEDFTLLSNTPVVFSKILNDGKKKGAVKSSGLKVVQFEKTPIMSTYLLAWVIGKLDFVEAFTEKSYNGRHVPVRVYTQEGISDQGKFGLEVASKIVDYFSEIFEIDYALPKLDLVSVPTYSHNAMENWGLITFRPTALLFDEKTSEMRYKRNVASIVSHELAHQWFGDLVTMDWWNELWLNEGFATWVADVALEYLYPEWRPFDVNTASAMQTAFRLDALKSSHPVEVEIQSSSDIDQVFDAISYLKGGAVINQIARYLGVEVFIKGVSAYLKKNIYSNGTTNDLLQSISEVSGIDVLSKANDWIRKIGFPVVNVKQHENGDVEFTQSRFLSSGEVSEEDDQTVWWIPLSVSTGKDDSDLIADLELTSKSTIVKGLGKSFFKVNKNTNGFYRVTYDSKSFNTIKENFDKLTIADKIGLVTDAVTTSIAGLTPTSGLLDLLNSFKGEDFSIVLSSIVESWSVLKGAWFETSIVNDEIHSGLSKFFYEVISPYVLDLSLNDDPNVDFLTAQVRTELLTAGVNSKISKVISESKEIFASGSEIHPSLRSVVYKAILSDSNATEEDFDKIYNIMKASKALDAREVILGALASVTNPKLISKAVGLILSDEIPIMDVQFVAYPLAKNTAARYTFLKYVKENYDAIYTRLNANPVVFDRFVKFTFNQFASDEAHDVIEKIFTGKDKYGFERSLDQSLESVKSNAAWVKRDKEDVEKWLKQHNYI